MKDQISEINSQFNAIQNDNLEFQTSISNLRSDLTTTENTHSSNVAEIRDDLSTVRNTLSDLVNDTPDLGIILLFRYCQY